jgi:NAD(P)-dependent dehydrogenase (short-subunit alcohol dehydrogenase family)
VDVAGTAAIVTGGASGLGLATARRLRDAGARVLVIDLPGHGTEDEFDLSFTTADVTDPVQLEGAIARATELGPLRTLVTCAGIAPGDRAVKRNGPLPLDDFARVIHLNLIGTFNAIRLAAAAMMVETESDGERGVIVTTSSVAAFDGQIGQSAYAASKAGVAGMTLPLAREFAASLIRVVSIAPGIFATPLLAALPDETRESLAAQMQHPMRPGYPEEFAALVLHVLQNPMINGETIRLDGAMRMGPH